MTSFPSSGLCEGGTTTCSTQTITAHWLRLTLEVRFDQATQQRFRQLAGGQSFSRQLVEPIARAAVYVALQFERNVSLDRWVREVRGSLEKAWQAGLIEEGNYRHVSDNLPRWFAVIADRGFENGDRILYRGYPDAMRRCWSRTTAASSWTRPILEPRRAARC